MACDNCGEGEAKFRLTQIVDNEMKTLNLCEGCAGEKGIESPPLSETFPLSELLGQMGGLTVPLTSGTEATESCPFCGLTVADFKDSGRLGCPQCWSAFDPQLRGLLRRIHGSTQHVGKVYLSPDPSVSMKEKRLDGLRRKLRRAVELEDFEKAAGLRDQIRTLEPAP